MRGRRDLAAAESHDRVEVRLPGVDTLRMHAGDRPRPSDEVVAAFGLSGPVVPLPGGQGRSWRCGAAVLKPADLDETDVAWQSDVLSIVDGAAGFRVSSPLQARDGRWVVSGWTAWRWEPGRHETGRWADVIDVGHGLHAALAGFDEPTWLKDRTDPWAIGDRVAWGELSPDGYAAVTHLDALVSALRPVSGRSQLIHGDLTGNVLFDDDLPPLVIDLSPYWRPPQFAAAVVVADALVWEGAGPEVVDLLGNDPGASQYLLRALIFRAVTDQVAHPDADLAEDRYLPAVTLALRLASTT